VADKKDMTITPASSPSLFPTGPAQPAQPPAQPKTDLPQDTVHLSHAAQTGGDADHDGDSH